MPIAKSAKILVVVAALGLVAPIAAADQEDTRLDGLFERLRAAPSAREGEQLQTRIWEIWLETDDPHAAKLMRQGIVATDGRHYTRALERFDELVTLAPEYAEAWNRRATVHYLMGDYAASVGDIQQTLALEPRHFGALSGLGMIYDALDREDAALRSFEAALALNPHLGGARERAAEIRRESRGQRT
jgi:tetratricopeptide (TPR) repeat protein